MRERYLEIAAIQIVGIRRRFLVEHLMFIVRYFSVLLATSVVVFGQRSLPESVDSTAVFLRVTNAVTGASWLGSGFYLRDGTNFLYLVTAKHVLLQPNTTNLATHIEAISYHGYDDTNAVVRAMNVSVLMAKGNVRLHEKHDVALLRIGRYQDTSDVSHNAVGVEEKSPGPSWTIARDLILQYRDVYLGNDAFVLGFPVSVGGPGQLAPERPLLRKGSVSGKNPGKQTLVLDAAVFKGNSGGPAFLFESGFNYRRVKLIGVVTEAVLIFDTRESSLYGQVTQVDIANSGYSIIEPMDFVLELFWPPESPAPAKVSP